jgi:hypothetical protein
MAAHPAWHLPLGYKDGVFGAERVPSGAYLGDRDMFLFLVDGNRDLDDPTDAPTPDCSAGSSSGTAMWAPPPSPWMCSCSAPCAAITSSGASSTWPASGAGTWALPVAEEVVARHERLRLSARDSARVLELLEHPPKPTAALRAAARRLRRHRQ